MIRAVRGAIQIEKDKAEAIYHGVTTLVARVMTDNGIEESAIISLQFTITRDLKALNPACALREIGFSQVPLFCAQEPHCDGDLPRIVRILLLCETSRTEPLTPAYLGGAQSLRPDLDSETALE